MNHRMLKQLIREEVTKALNEETWADAAKRHKINGNFDNELLSYMRNLFQSIKNLNSYPLAKNFPENQADIAKIKQAFKTLENTRFGKLFMEE